MQDLSSRDFSDSALSDAPSVTSQNWSNFSDPTLAQPTRSRHLVIISDNVSDVTTLKANVNAGYEIAVIDAFQDGVAQISQILANYTDLASLHIVSHGASGSLQLGSTNLNLTNLESSSGQIKSWSSAFEAGADILLYGCDVAAGTGIDLVNQISQLTGTNVAASNNATGNAAAGGDWTLEYATGAIAAPIAFSATLFANYGDILAPFVNYANFASTTGLQLNGNAARSGNVLRLTPDERSQKGTAFATSQIGITGDTSFNTQFQFQLGGTLGTNGADGITFMLQNNGISALGEEGGALGYGGITSSLAISFDTYQGEGDIDNNHVSILQNGNVITAVATKTAGIDLNSGSLVNAWVDYNGATNKLDVYLASTTTKPGTALLSTTVDLPTVVGNSAYAGFSGSTGFFTNVQDIQSWTMDVTDAGTPPPNSTGDGLRGEYYDNIDFTNLKVTRVDPTVNFAFGNGSPDPTIGADDFSVRWTGKVQPRYTEAYTFYTLSDDGVRLTVNGQKIIDNFTFHAPTEDRSSTVTLQAGQQYDITMEFFEGQGGATAKLSWSSASQGKEIISQSQLFSPPVSTQGTIALAQNSYSVNEGGGNANITVLRTGNSSGAASVKYRTFDGTAIAGADYTAVDATLNFAAGETSKTIAVPIIDDTIAENTETFSITIDRAEGANLGTVRTATVAIADNDTTLGTGTGLRGQYYDNRNFTDLKVTRVDPTVDFNFGSGSPDPTIQPDTFSAIWTGQVQPLYNETYTFYTLSDDGVRLSVNGQQIINNFTDHGPTENNGTIALQAGQKYDIRMDYYENGGGAVARLLWSSGSQTKQVIPKTQLYAPATGSAGQIALAQSTYTVKEDGTTATIAVNRNDGTDGVVTVRYATTNGSATAGSDYTLTAGTLTFAAGESTKNIIIPITNDTVVEKNETVNITLSNAGGGATLGSQTTAVLTIVDNDPGSFESQIYVSGLTSPTAIDFTPDGKRIYVAQKNGIVRVIDNGTLLAGAFVDLSDEVNDTRDRGLLGIAVDPKFDQGRPYIYLGYTYDPPEADRTNATPNGLDNADANGNRPSRVVRIEADAATGFRTAKAGTKTVILGKNSTWANTSRPDGNSTDDFTIAPSGFLPNGQPVADYLATDSESHSIGQLRFGTDGQLFVSNGDGTSYNQIDKRAVRVQDIDNLSGKVLRIDPDTGNGLADNPFYNVAAGVDPDTQYNSDPTSNRAKVYNLGFRNPFRITVNKTTNRPFIGDVGWYTWEEIDTGRGINGGWPFYEGGAKGSEKAPQYQNLPEAVAFYASGKLVDAPLYARSHETEGARAIIVGDFYTGTTYPGVYNNALFFGDANTGEVNAAILDANGKVDTIKPFATGAFGVVQMQMGPDGNLYYVNLGALDTPGTGAIGRWVPTAQGSLLSGRPTQRFDRFLFDAGPKTAADIKQ